MCDHILMTEGSGLFLRDLRWCKPPSAKRLLQKTWARENAREISHGDFREPDDMRESRGFVHSLQIGAPALCVQAM